jgi:flavin reductase (DIM6/NTAB) family NADH-FMN oxidoreductase RutF/DNA-binding IclR family transcriptional regulator
MGDTSGSSPIHPLLFRRVLGHFPTGVAGITSIDADGHPVGMAVGSFTSVSLDPPLVAFLPDKSSTTFPKIRDAGFFCVNVLAANQEAVCRAFSAKSADKFVGISWRSAGSGAPLIDGAVAWIDCDIDAIYDAGDHDIVIGRVRALDVDNATLPLLFFQGGYGRFAPLSLAAVSEPDLVEQLRLADRIRPQMERVSVDAHAECLATVIVQDQMVILAGTSKPDAKGLPTRVGQRIPFSPPLGAAFVAWDRDAARQWLDRLGADVGPEERQRYGRVLDRVRSRGWSLALESDTYREFEAALARMKSSVSTPDELRSVRSAVDRLGGEYEPENLHEGNAYPVRNLNVPVFGPTGAVVLLLSVYNLPRQSSLAQITHYRDCLKRAAAEVSTLIMNL